MNIIVLMKQVPDTNKVKIDPKTNTLIRKGVPSIINPDDKHALEEALKTRDKYGGKVTVLSMGPPQAKEAIVETLAMGADEGILLSDMAFAGADTWATSYSLGMAIKKIGDFDLIFAGREATDGDTAQIGPQTAEALGIPQVTYAIEVNKKGDKYLVKRAMEDGYEVIEVPSPALITCIKELNKPRYPPISGIQKALKTDIPVWSAENIDAEPEKIGLKGSPTIVAKSFVPEPKEKGEILEGEPKELAAGLFKKLKEINVIQE